VSIITAGSITCLWTKLRKKTWTSYWGKKGTLWYVGRQQTRLTFHRTWRWCWCWWC